jgi:hypothetical protein
MIPQNQGGGGYPLIREPALSVVVVIRKTEGRALARAIRPNVYRLPVGQVATTQGGRA